MKTIRSFWNDEDGATAIEYGFIALLVGVGIVSGLQLLPPALNAVFNSVVTVLN